MEPQKQKDETDANWRQFPQFTKIFEPDQLQPFVASVEKTCRSLQEIVRSGSKPEQERAQATLGAYCRALALVKELQDLQETEAAKQATSQASNR